MRVTKTVREYIEDKVRDILMERKYKAMQIENEGKNALYARVLDKANEAAKMAFEACFNEHINELIKYYDPVVYNQFSCHNYRYLKENERGSALNLWANNLYKEVNDITRNIIVELELGGTKADLERLLKEI